MSKAVYHNIVHNGEVKRNINVLQLIREQKEKENRRKVASLVQLTARLQNLVVV